LIKYIEAAPSPTTVPTDKRMEDKEGKGIFSYWTKAR